MEKKTISILTKKGENFYLYAPKTTNNCQGVKWYEDTKKKK